MPPLGPSSSFVAKLSSRGVVRVHGPDSLKFLQTLITNDLHQICNGASPNACAAAFLNRKGRVMFGAIIQRQQDNDYLIDLEHQQVPSLINHMNMYRLRADVQVSDQSHMHSVWSLVNVDQDSLRHDSRVFEDPRLGALGLRAIVDDSFSPPSDVHVTDEQQYNCLRILNGVPDGSDFHNTPLPLDLALHLLNGVSFNKGCYLGQELTARSHFTGVLRKRITPVIVSDSNDLSDKYASSMVSDAADLRLESGAELMLQGKSKAVAKVSSSVHNIGMAVIRLTDVFSEEGTRQLHLRDGRSVTAWRPQWWRERDNGQVQHESS
ncbi:hypothetical protein FGB62_104g045 [Gracilaria domingensis]|nr:hypothetical protein FGB62_104g045 [Gracilaria domingensis]